MKFTSKCYKITNDDAKKCVFEGFDYFCIGIKKFCALRMLIQN